MSNHQLVSKTSLNQLLVDSNKAWERCDFQLFFDLLEQASKLAPDDFHILLQLGQAYGLRYNYDAAQRCFETAVRIAPNKSGILATIARLSADFNVSGISEHYFERALSDQNTTAETISRFADFLERRRHHDKAANLVDRALHLDNNCGLARLVRARLELQAGQYEEATRTLQPVLISADRDTRVRAHYELGTILDRLNRFDEAMSAFLGAKILLRADAPSQFIQLQAIVNHISQMEQNISSKKLHRWFKSGQKFLSPPRPLALLTGHARSGTTLLEQVLDSHPDIVSAEETKIFNDEVYSPLRRNLALGTSMLAGLEMAQMEDLRKSRQRYFNTMELHLGVPIGQRLLVDKNPGIHYFIPPFIRVFPEIKFIVALRDPRDVVLSCFMQSYLPITTANVNYLDLGSAVERYTRVMGLWQKLKHQIPTPWLEVRYEDVIDNLEAAAHKTLDFLCVPWDAKVLDFNDHAQKKLVRTPTYSDVTKKIYNRSKGRWKNYQKFLEPHLHKLKDLIKAFGYE